MRKIESINIALTGDARAPKRMTSGAVAYDLYCSADTVIKPHSRTIVPSGVSIDLPAGIEAQIRPRSGFSAKGFEGVSNNIIDRFDADILLGTIDSDYKLPVGIIVKSNDDREFTCIKGTRIAQLVISRVETPKLNIVNSLEPNNRLGFGHTGTK